jgi:hypothetical protein
MKTKAKTYIKTKTVVSETNDLDVALFLQREKHRLCEVHHNFIDSMVWHLRFPSVTLKQRQYLHHLLDKLGGKITT